MFIVTVFRKVTNRNFEFKKKAWLLGKRKLANILALDTRGGKRNQIWVVVTYIKGVFDLLVSKIALGTFGALVLKWLVTRKRMAVERN